jgi:hypothetical protein
VYNNIIHAKNYKSFSSTNLYKIFESVSRIKAKSKKGETALENTTKAYGPEFRSSGSVTGRRFVPFR